MNKLVAILASTATTAVVVLHGGAVMAQGDGPSGAWPAAYPLPTSPGTVTSQTSTTAVVRSTDSVALVKSKLDTLYVTQRGCTLRAAVNKPKDYFCGNAATGKTDEIYFTFAALDPTASDASRSQSNAFYARG